MRVVHRNCCNFPSKIKFIKYYPRKTQWLKTIYCCLSWLEGCGFICVAAVGEPVTWLQSAGGGWDQPNLCSPRPWHGGPDPQRSAGHLALYSFCAQPYWASSDHSGLRVIGPSAVTGFSQKEQRSEWTTARESTLSQSTALLVFQCLFFTMPHTNKTIQNKGQNPTVLLLTSHSKQLISYFLII